MRSFRALRNFRNIGNAHLHVNLFSSPQAPGAQLAAMRAVKRRLDPQDILGRGTLFEPGG